MDAGTVADDADEEALVVRRELNNLCRSVDKLCLFITPQRLLRFKVR